jgi:hypothetical protein
MSHFTLYFQLQYVAQVLSISWCKLLLTLGYFVFVLHPAAMFVYILKIFSGRLVTPRARLPDLEASKVTAAPTSFFKD